LARKAAEPTLETLHVSTREAWRAWLARHHLTATEVWLRYAKRHTGEPRVEYDAAVEEALCYGWIDGLVRSIDDRYYAQRFSPRRPGSTWSLINRRRYAKLLREGRLAEAGLGKAPPAGSSMPEDASRPPDAGTSIEPAVPPDFRRALKASPQAWRTFENLAPSYRRFYLGWIAAAKREATRTRRIAEAISLLAAGKKLGIK
jgi:uncharacterized protein YdeI (YjbR/CyaY-like superfamily)